MEVEILEIVEEILEGRSLQAVDGNGTHYFVEHKKVTLISISQVPQMLQDISMIILWYIKWPQEEERSIVSH